MDFLINNMGWFFCIAIVSVLALIGYKADKKEKSQNTNNKNIQKEIPTYEEPTIERKEEEQSIQEDNFYYNPQQELKPIENNQMSTDEEMAALYEPLPPMQNQSQTKENPNENEEQNEINPNGNEEQNEINQNEMNDLYHIEPTNAFDKQEEQQLEPQQEEPIQIVPDTNNLENLNISLQDLENKNYNQLLNKMNKPEEYNQEIQNENQEKINQPEQQNEIQSSDQVNYDIQKTTDNTQQMINQTIQEQDANIETNQQENEQEQTQEISELSNQIPQNNENMSKELEEHQFDNEINNETNKEIQQPLDQQEQNNNLIFNPQEKIYDGEIPELFANNQQGDETSKDMNYMEKSEISKSENDTETNLYSDSIDDDIWKF